MAATIKIKNSSTTGAVPTSSDLVQGELAVNVADLGLYTENASGTVVKLNAPSIDDKNTGATKHLTISTAGNLGLGVTPSAWGSIKALQVVNAGFGGLGGGNYSSANAYYDGSVWRYITSNFATLYQQSGNAGDGTHKWNVAPSGTAGNAITFTQAMTLDASGNLGVGTTSPTSVSNYKGITLNGTTGGLVDIASNGTVGLRLQCDTSYPGGALFTLTNQPMVFGTNGTERARIDSSGRLLVNVTSLTNLENGTTNSACIREQGTIEVGKNTTSSINVAEFYNPNGNIGKISISGSSTTYATSSDYRLKEQVQPLIGALARVSALKPVTYKWKVDGSDGEGFIAHELQAVVPDAVVGEKDAVDAEGNPVYQGIDTSFLVATLTAAIQELKAEVDSLKAQIAGA